MYVSDFLLRRWEMQVVGVRLCLQHSMSPCHLQTTVELEVHADDGTEVNGRRS